MDIELARTFLAISAAGSFVRAAEQLHLTQTAVSARIKALEEQLGRSLFVRNKHGVQLTPAGQEFSKYATALVQLWERARQQVAVPAGRRALVSVGAEPNLWNPLLLNWIVSMRTQAPDVAVRAQVDLPDRLIDKAQMGILDMALLYTPHHRPGFVVEEILEEALVAVSTHEGTTSVGEQGYVYIDWGPAFSAQHERAFPHLRDTDMHVGLGPLALRYILAMGGSGYFRMRAVKPYLAQRRLFPIIGAPSFSYPVYLLISDQAEPEIVTLVRESLQRAAAIESEDWA